MDMYWIINDSIEFRPGEKMLISVKDPELNVVLTAPASRCLLLLLEASGEIVQQKEFFKKVWEKEGMLVPTNTLYQNISIVRRGLRAVGESAETIIVTIPRKGFQISSDVKIDVVNMAKDTDASPAENRGVRLNEELKPKAGKEEGANATPQTRQPQQRSSNQNNNSTIQIKSIPLLYMLVSVALGLIIISFLRLSHDDTSFFNLYILYGLEDGCHFYSKNDDPGDNNNYQKFKTIIKGSGLDCKKYPWIYFSSSEAMPALTAVVCREMYSTKAQPRCISLYFMERDGD